MKIAICARMQKTKQYFINNFGVAKYIYKYKNNNNKGKEIYKIKKLNIYNK